VWGGGEHKGELRSAGALEACVSARFECTFIFVLRRRGDLSFICKNPRGILWIGGGRHERYVGSFSRFCGSYFGAKPWG